MIFFSLNKNKVLLAVFDNSFFEIRELLIFYSLNLKVLNILDYEQQKVNS